MDRRIEQDEQQIYEQAAMWMLRKEDEPLSRAQLRRYEAWLKLPRHAEALRQMEVLAEWMRKSWRRRRLSLTVVTQNLARPDIETPKQQP